MTTSRIMIIGVLALLGAGLRAQETGDLIPSGQRLKGKVGAKIESGFMPELAPRKLDLARMELPGRVEEAFLERLGERLDEDEYEMLRQRRVERMQRKLGTTVVEAARIRESLGIADEEPRRGKRPVPAKTEDDSLSVWLFFSALGGLFVYLFWKTRAV